MYILGERPESIFSSLIWNAFKSSNPQNSTFTHILKFTLSLTIWRHFKKTQTEQGKSSIHKGRKVNRQKSYCTSGEGNQLPITTVSCCSLISVSSWLPTAELPSMSKWKTLPSAEAELKGKYSRKKNIGKNRGQARIKAISSPYIQQWSCSFLVLVFASALIKAPH